MRHVHVTGLLLFLCATLPAMTEEQSHEIFPALQAAFARLPELPVADVDGKRFSSFELNRNPVLAAGARVDAVRLHVPDHGGDLVWAFAIPLHCSSWYILPRTGSGPGFTGFLRGRHWRESTWPSDPSYRSYLQTLASTSLQPGGDYLIWFEFTSEAPATVHAAARFAAPRPEDWDEQAIESALGLAAAELDQRAQRFGTRGGRLLRDQRLMAQPFGDLRLHSLLNLLDGIPIAIATAPGRLPSIGAATALLGDPDLVLEHDALLAAGMATLGDDESMPGTTVALAAGMRSALFDHVVLTARNDDAPAVSLDVLRWDASRTAARSGEDALDHLPGGWTLAHRGKRLVAVLRDLGGPAGSVAHGSLPAGTWHGRSDAGWIAEEVVIDGTGSGSRVLFAHPGVRTQAFTLRAWRYQGEGTAWYDGKRTRAIVHYLDGLLEGDAVWYELDGTVAARATYRSGKRQAAPAPAQRR